MWKPNRDCVTQTDSNRDDEPTVVVPLESGVRRMSDGPPAPQGIWRSVIRVIEQTVDDTDQAQADRHFQAAAVLLERGYAREAVFEAQKALRLCRPRPEQQALYAWALYQRSGAGAHVPTPVWEHLESALQTDPECQSARHFMSLLLTKRDTR